MKSADLVGRWVEVGDSANTVVEFYADSSYIVRIVHRKTYSMRRPGAVSPQDKIRTVGSRITGTWHLAGDTLTTAPRTVTDTTESGEWVDMGPPIGIEFGGSVLVGIKRTRMTMTLMAPTPPTHRQQTLVFERRELSAAAGKAPAAADSARPPKP